MSDITLRGQWLIQAPQSDVYALITDFEQWPEYFPNVAQSIRVARRDGDRVELEAMVKSFGRTFPVHMNTKILPGKGFVSDNDSPVFGTSGHEKLVLSARGQGTVIDYTYQVTIHKFWLRIIARPLIGWFSMKYWEKAVVDELRKRLER